MPRPSKSSISSPELVLKVLRKNAQPLSAYAILEKVQKFGIKSPPIVYRALDALMESGKVHKINELNTFVACDCEDDHQHSLSALTICQNCHEVHELHDHVVIDHLTKLKALNIDLVSQAVIELPIICDKCAA
jgi:Fur family transcriptional regulator, zinc uptake regulator